MNALHGKQGSIVFMSADGKFCLFYGKPTMATGMFYF